MPKKRSRKTSLTSLTNKGNGRRRVADSTLKKAVTVFGDQSLNNSSHNKGGIKLVLKRGIELLDGGCTYFRFDATVTDNRTKKVLKGFEESWECNDMFPWGTFGKVAPYMMWTRVN
tara:strand:- start:274 stop:621 length:348 start_codon:yes stop_codon:yes gene_type:complete